MRHEVRRERTAQKSRPACQAEAPVDTCRQLERQLYTLRNAHDQKGTLMSGIAQVQAKNRFLGASDF